MKPWPRVEAIVQAAAFGKGEISYMLKKKNKSQFQPFLHNAQISKQDVCFAHGHAQINNKE